MTAPDGEPGSDTDDSAAKASLLPPAVGSSLLWGVVGGLSFLVLVQGYDLLTDQGVTVGAKAGVALAVALVAATTTQFVRSRLPEENESP